MILRAITLPLRLPCFIIGAILCVVAMLIIEIGGGFLAIADMGFGIKRGFSANDDEA